MLAPTLVSIFFYFFIFLSKPQYLVEEEGERGGGKGGKDMQKPKRKQRPKNSNLLL